MLTGKHFDKPKYPSNKLELKKNIKSSQVLKTIKIKKKLINYFGGPNVGRTGPSPTVSYLYYYFFHYCLFL